MSRQKLFRGLSLSSANVKLNTWLLKAQKMGFCFRSSTLNQKGFELCLTGTKPEKTKQPRDSCLPQMSPPSTFSKNSCDGVSLPCGVPVSGCSQPLLPSHRAWPLASGLHSWQPTQETREKYIWREYCSCPLQDTEMTENNVSFGFNICPSLQDTDFDPYSPQFSEEGVFISGVSYSAPLLA